MSSTGDDFLQHNAFRSPGAPSLEELRVIPKKVRHHAGRYSLMRNGIVAHDVDLDEGNVDALEGMDFAFICVDRPPLARRNGPSSKGWSNSISRSLMWGWGLSLWMIGFRASYG